MLVKIYMVKKKSLVDIQLFLLLHIAMPSGMAKELFFASARSNVQIAH